MMIQIEATPNPATLKFLPGRVLHDGAARDFDNAENAAASPLARALFGLSGVARVHLGRDFIAVTATKTADWDALRPQISAEIAAVLAQSDDPVGPPPEMSFEAQFDAADAETVAQIEALLESHVKPAVAQDGGDVSLYGFDRGIAYMRMTGACAGCPSSTMTLKMGIERLLRHQIPEVLEVRPVQA